MPKRRDDHHKDRSYSKRGENGRDSAREADLKERRITSTKRKGKASLCWRCRLLRLRKDFPLKGKFTGGLFFDRNTARKKKEMGDPRHRREGNGEKKRSSWRSRCREYEKRSNKRFLLLTGVRGMLTSKRVRGGRDQWHKLPHFCCALFLAGGEDPSSGEGQGAIRNQQNGLLT